MIIIILIKIKIVLLFKPLIEYSECHTYWIPINKERKLKEKEGYKNKKKSLYHSDVYAMISNTVPWFLQYRLDTRIINEKVKRREA